MSHEQRTEHHWQRYELIDGVRWVGKDRESRSRCLCGWVGEWRPSSRQVRVRADYQIHEVHAAGVGAPPVD